MVFDWMRDLTLAQIAKLREDGLFTDEMLAEAGLTDEAIAKANEVARQEAEVNPAFREGLRALLMHAWEKEHGDKTDES